MKCKVCGENESWILIGLHYKEKHAAYFRAYRRMKFLRGFASTIGAVMLLYFVTVDVSPDSLSFLFRIYVPLYAAGFVLMWAVVNRRLAGIAKSLRMGKSD